MSGPDSADRKCFNCEEQRHTQRNCLKLQHWRAELRQVEVFENERWNPNSREGSGSTTSPISGSGFLGSLSQGANDNADAGGGKNYRTGWGKSNLKSGERKAWTRGRDGWSGIAEGGDVRFVFFPSLLHNSPLCDG